MKMILVAGFVIMTFTASAQRQMENINRGLIAVSLSHDSGMDQPKKPAIFVVPR